MFQVDDLIGGQKAVRFGHGGDPVSMLDDGAMTVGYHINPLRAHDYGGYTKPKPAAFGKIVNPIVTEKLIVNDVIQTPITTQITEPRAIIGKPVPPTVNMYDGGNIQPFKIDGITGYRIIPQVTLEQIHGKT